MWNLCIVCKKEKKINNFEVTATTFRAYNKCKIVKLLTKISFFLHFREIKTTNLSSDFLVSLTQTIFTARSLASPTKPSFQ